VDLEMCDIGEERQSAQRIERPCTIAVDVELLNLENGRHSFYTGDCTETEGKPCPSGVEGIAVLSYSLLCPRPNVYVCLVNVTNCRPQGSGVSPNPSCVSGHTTCFAVHTARRQRLPEYDDGERILSLRACGETMRELPKKRA